MSQPAKRFYERAHATEETAGWSVRLDERLLKTPAQRELLLPVAALAEAVAEEWTAQTEDIRPHTMPLTQLAFTAVDRVGPERAAIVEQTARFGETDMVCYRADEPPDLVVMQAEVWDPVLDWARGEFGVDFRLTTGIVPVSQPEETVPRLAERLDTLDDYRLAAVTLAAQASGSLLVALAMTSGALATDDAVVAAQLDETFQARLWGLDYEAEMRLAGLAGDIRTAARFLRLL